ncbi:MAG TPA: hypothetical protein VFF84_05345 [Sphingobium sp.]|nr:hypothetical protein [Sphingobium sp.]
MDQEQKEQARELHQTLEFIGLRAHATTVGLLQLSTELVRVGILDADAIQRIKDAIHREITVARPRGYNRAEFAETLRQRLDAIFPSCGDGERKTEVGTLEDMKSALATDHDSADEM